MTREGNSVFAQQPQQSSSPPTAEQTPAPRIDMGFDPAIELVPLPSLGKVYPEGHPLNGMTSIGIRPMSTREEDILMNKAALKSGMAISNLLKACIAVDGLDPVSMLSGDRNAILTAIRITAYSANYEAEIKCGSCGKKYKHTFDLSSLPIRLLDIEPVQPNSNLFEFKLPVSGRVVHFKFQTGLDELIVHQTDAQKKKIEMTNDANEITEMLIRHIVAVDGQTDRTQIANFIRCGRMSARDSLAFRAFMGEHNPSIVFNQETTCNFCDESEEVSVPLGVNFLWPGTK